MMFNVDSSRFERSLSKITPAAVDAVVKLNMTEIYNRGKAPGGTPVRTGELRQSLGITRDATGYVVGYTKEYAPDVEYGRRTKGGGWINGKHYFQKNINEQGPRLEKDLAKLVAEWGRA